MLHARRKAIQANTPLPCSHACSFSGGDHSGDAVGQGSACAVAGAIAVTISNYVFLTLFGSSEDNFPDALPEEESEVKIDK